MTEVRDKVPTAFVVGDDIMVLRGSGGATTFERVIAGDVVTKDVGVDEGDVPVLGVGGLLNPAVLPVTSGLPAGGADAQVLAKASATNYDVEWVNQSAGTGGAALPVGGATGQALVKISATDADVTWGNIPNDAADINAVPDTPVGFRSSSEDAAADATEGPLLGAAQHTADLAQTKTALLSQMSAIAAKAELVLFAAPYSAPGVPPAVVGDEVMTVGAQIETHLWGVNLVGATGMESVPDTFPYAQAGDGLIVSKTAYEAWKLMQVGRNYASRTVSLISNVLTFSADAGRKILTSTLTANSTIASSCWDFIGEHEEEIDLFVPIGGTAYTFLPASSTVAYFTPALTINTIAMFRLGRYGGSIPYMRHVGNLGAASAAMPSFVASSFALNTAGSVTPPATVPGTDRILVFAYNNTNATQPALPAGWTDVNVGAGDANTPALRVATKLAATTAETVTGFVVGTNTIQTYAFVFRKAGTPPTIGPTSYSKTATTATTAMSWGALTLAQDAIVVGINALVSTDIGALRSGLVPETPQTGNGGNHQTLTGVSTLQTAGTWASASTTKTVSVLGRAITCQVALY